jgi:hypothetical protein
MPKLFPDWLFLLSEKRKQKTYSFRSAAGLSAICLRLRSTEATSRLPADVETRGAKDIDALFSAFTWLLPWPADSSSWQIKAQIFRHAEQTCPSRC